MYKHAHKHLPLMVTGNLKGTLEIFSNKIQSTTKKGLNSWHSNSNSQFQGEMWGPE